MRDIVGAGATMAGVEDDMAWVKVVVVRVKTALRGPRSRLARHEPWSQRTMVCLMQPESDPAHPRPKKTPKRKGNEK